MFRSPPFTFMFVWFIVSIMYAANLSYMLDSISLKTIYLIAFSIFLMYLGWGGARFSTSKARSLKVVQKNYILYFSSKRREQRLKLTLKVWLVLTILEVLFYKNLPLISALGIGPYVRYSQFGFPGIHGFLNAIYFSLLSYFFIKAIILKKRRDYILVFFLFVWPFLALSRMMIMASVIQLFFLTIIISEKSLDSIKIVKYILIALLVVLLFGFMGDIRNGREHLLSLAQLTFEYPEWLPSGFAWIYLYVTTPLNNINFALEQYLEPSYFPIEIVTRIFPSFFRDYIYDMVGRVDDSLFVSNAFNISTLFLPIVKDFGWVLSPFLFFVVGFFSYLVVAKAIDNPRYVVFWSVLLYSIVISIFSNHMFHLVFWAEAIFSFLIYGKKNE